VKDAHSLKNSVPRVNDAGYHTAWEAIGRWRSAIFKIRKEHLQYEVIGNDRELATLGLEVW
jgi:hypothetical protein